MRFLIGLLCGMILAGNLATAASDPCSSLTNVIKKQNQIENLRFKQRRFIERYQEGKR